MRKWLGVCFLFSYFSLVTGLKKAKKNLSGIKDKHYDAQTEKLCILELQKHLGNILGKMSTSKKFSKKKLLASLTPRFIQRPKKTNTAAQVAASTSTAFIHVSSSSFGHPLPTAPNAQPTQSLANLPIGDPFECGAQEKIMLIFEYLKILFRNEENRSLAQQNDIKTMVEIIKIFPHNEEFISIAISTMHNLSLCQENKITIQKVGGITLLINLLKREYKVCIFFIFSPVIYQKYSFSAK